MDTINQIYPHPLTKRFITAVRLLLIASIGMLICSSLLMLILGFDNNMAWTISWFSIMGSVTIYYFSILVFTRIVIYAKIKKEKFWELIKREVKLFVFSIASLLLLGVINNFILN